MSNVLMTLGSPKKTFSRREEDWEPLSLVPKKSPRGICINVGRVYQEVIPPKVV